MPGYKSIYNEQTGEYDSVQYYCDVILPDLGKINIYGSINDNSTLIYNLDSLDLVSYLPLGEVTLDLALNADLRSNSSHQYITYTGNFSCGVLSTSGSVNVDFFSFPDYQELISGEASLPLVSKIEVNGSLATKLVTLSDGIIVEFVEVPYENYNVLPSYIKVYGDVEYKEDNDITNLSGELSLSLDYSTRSSLAEEHENNYISGMLDFKGGYSKTGFSPLQLEIKAARTGFDDYSANVKYFFGEGRMINTGFQHEDKIIKIGAYNENGIKLLMEIDTEKIYTAEKIGEITNFDGTEHYADIKLDDRQLTVIWRNNMVTSLFY